MKHIAAPGKEKTNTAYCTKIGVQRDNVIISLSVNAYREKKSNLESRSEKREHSNKARGRAKRREKAEESKVEKSEDTY